ncbi:MAG: HAMP domain-containing histidine kinase [Defluviitaleaceae bacterium]|nr:HAMP domain-containing histidine kinase [Defluviitaleaceae bacterium]MCL2239501.1 HAMP domain-containing histidine kinase [Defluviitaleaceae bacterium]
MLLTEETALGGMTAALAHEIKNPAALALAHVQLLRGGTEDITHSCDHIERALETIVDLAQEMLSVTYSQPLAYDFDLHELICDVLYAYQAAWPGIAFSLTPETGEMPLRASEVCVHMVLSNLIKNAVEAVTCARLHHPEISLSVGLQDEWLYICIRDNGPGYHEDFTHIKKPHGNGLGLPIAQWLLTRLGGDLAMRPGLLGGCEAVVRLPRIPFAPLPAH